MVASVVGAIATAANFDAQPNQQSAPVHLTAGQQVFIEAFSKEATGTTTSRWPGAAPASAGR